MGANAGRVLGTVPREAARPRKWQNVTYPRLSHVLKLQIIFLYWNLSMLSKYISNFLCTRMVIIPRLPQAEEMLTWSTWSSNRNSLIHGSSINYIREITTVYNIMPLQLRNFVTCERNTSFSGVIHYREFILSVMVSQTTGVSSVYSTICSGVDQRKHQSSASLFFVRRIHRWPVNSPHKGPITRKLLPFDDVIMTNFVTAGVKL